MDEMCELTSGWFFRAVVRGVSLSKVGKSGGFNFFVSLSKVGKSGGFNFLRYIPKCTC